MYYGFYRGRGAGRGGGGGMGFGFRGSSPPWPYVGRGRGGLPRCGYYLGGAAGPLPQSYGAGVPAGYGYNPYPPYAPQTGVDELGSLKAQADAIKGQLEEIESRMRELEQEK